MSYAVVGGTFDTLHKGHRMLIARAFRTADRVLVCVTSDGMAGRKHLAYRIGTYHSRRKRLEGFLRDRGWLGRAEILKITDPFTEGLRPGLTHIIVSPETLANARKLNAMRRQKGLRELEIVVVDWVMAADGRPISDGRIRNGEIDGDGNLV